MAQEQISGLMVSVYRSSYQNTTNGITSTHDRLILTGDDVPEVFEASETTPALKLVRRTFGFGDYLHAEPIEPTGKHRIFGGNFVYTSDGRFPNHYPIPVHDRTE